MGMDLPRRFSSLSRTRLGWLLAGLLVVLGMSATFASITAQTPGEVLDQQQTSTLSFTAITDSDPLDDTCARRGQTFTAGISGTLSRVELLVARTNSPLNGSLPPDLTVELWATSGGVPAGVPLASATIGASSVPVGTGALVSAAFPSPGPAVTAGTTYAVLARFATNLNNASGYSFGISGSNVYLGGAFVSQDCGALAFTVNNSFDMGFRTFVVPVQATATATTTATTPPTATPCPIGFECATPVVTPTEGPTATVTPVGTPPPASTCPPGFECAIIARQR